MDKELRAVTNASEELGRSFKSKMKDLIYRYKFFSTLALLFAFVTYGFQAGQKGPSFLDIQLITNTDTKTASTFFTSFYVGFFMGNTTIGFLIDRFNKMLLVFLSILLMGVSVIVIPLCSQYAWMLIAMWTNAFFMGCLNSGGNAFLLSIWGAKEGRSYIQAIHSFFALGAIVSPVVTAPFLSTLPEQTVVNSSSLENITTSGSFNQEYILPPPYNKGINTTSSIQDTQALSKTSTGEIKLFYAFLIAGCLSIVSAMPLLILYCRDSKSKQKTDTIDTTATKRDLPLKYYVLTVILIDLMFMFYCSVEITFHSFLLMFTVVECDWDKQQGSEVTSAFWCSFAATRFLGIILIRYINPSTILPIHIGLLTVSLTAFLLFSYFHIDVALWIVVVVVGFSMSIIFPTGISWVQENIITINGRVMSSIAIVASIGTVVNPLITGFLIQTRSPMWFCYVLVIESILLVIFFLILVRLYKVYLPKLREKFLRTTVTDTEYTEHMMGEVNL